MQSPVPKTLGQYSLGAGASHTCALSEGGTVKCWGSNGYGQLGDQSFIDSLSARSVFGVVGATAVSAGYLHSCALMADATVKCWGANSDGRLGNVTGWSVVNSPIPVWGVENATMIMAGYEFSCAIVQGGAVKCWGANHVGQLGNGSTQQSTFAVDVLGVTGATMLVGGAFHTCALVAGGAVKCWGYNLSGQLGNGSVVSSTTAVDVVGVTGAISLAAGWHHSCALMGNGSVRCWGAGARLGNGSWQYSTTAVDVTGVTGMTVLAAGSEHTCAAGAQMKCWGRNDLGQLGSGSLNPGMALIAEDVVGIDNVLSIAASYSHTCVETTEGAVRCWGFNSSGQLGINIAPYGWTTQPVTIASGITGISVGDNHTCATLPGGVTNCWGANTFGQLGDGTTVHSPMAIAVSGVAVAVKVTAGARNSCILGTGGRVHCWGNSGPLDVSSIVGATDLVMGPNHGCALLSGGTIKCWGANDVGQLGNGNTLPTSTPVDVIGISTATNLAVGFNHTCAVLADDTVKCWGGNYDGQLGTGDSTPSATPVLVGGISAVSALSAGYSNTCAVLAGGTIKCWGYNSLGQLGNGNTTTSFSPVSVQGISDAVSLAAGFLHNCAVTASATVKCWGGNFVGQLGNASTTHSTTPVDVIGLSEVTALSAQNAHNCALSQAGTAHCWGGNFYGELGRGTAGFVTTPQDVFGSPFFEGYTLIYSAGIHGSISGRLLQKARLGESGTAVTAVPAAGYHFVQWSDGSIANPRVDSNVSAHINVTAEFANAAPTIAVVADQQVFEDSGARNLIISIADLETAAGLLTVTASSSTPELIADPTVSAGVQPNERILGFVPAEDRNGGPVTITLTVTDVAGATEQRSFSIVVVPINDAPDFSVGNIVQSASTLGPHIVADFAVFDAGPADEDSTQGVADYLIDSIADADGILAPGSVDIDDMGSLTYALSGITGVATISARVRDSGGDDNGGVDISAPRQFTILSTLGTDLQIGNDNASSGLLDGETTIYSIVVANAGPNPAAGARLVDVLPTTLVDANWACVQANSTASCPAPGAGTGDLDVLVDVGVNEYLRFDMMAVVDGSVGAFVTNTATITSPSGVPELDTQNNNATDQDAIVPVGLYGDGFESVPLHMLTVPGAKKAMQLP